MKLHKAHLRDQKKKRKGEEGRFGQIPGKGKKGGGRGQVPRGRMPGQEKGGEDPTYTIASSKKGNKKKKGEETHSTNIKKRSPLAEKKKKGKRRGSRSTTSLPRRARGKEKKKKKP